MNKQADKLKELLEKVKLLDIRIGHLFTEKDRVMNQIASLSKTMIYVRRQKRHAHSLTQRFKLN